MTDTISSPLLTTQELLRPDVEDLGPPVPRWQRWLGRHQHCFHEDNLRSSPSDGKLARRCCHCDRLELSELKPVEHGRYFPADETAVRNWSDWYPAEQWYEGSWFLGAIGVCFAAYFIVVLVLS